MIRARLGHVSIDTTNVYAEVAGPGDRGAMAGAIRSPREHKLNGNARASVDSPHGCSGLKPSHDTLGFQFVNVPLGLSFHAQTCSV